MDKTTKFELNADDRELLRLRRLMDEMLATEPYLAYEKILHGQVETWRRFIEAPSSGMDAAFQSEFNKGTLYGIRLILDLPHRIIREASDILSRQEKLNERPTFTRPGESIDSGRSSYSSSPDAIADELGEPVGPNARVTADSNTE